MLFKLKENLPTIEILLGCIIYLYLLLETSLSIAVLWLILIIYVWLFTSLILNQYHFSTLINVLCNFGILIAISIFFMFGVEELPYPEGALLFHVEGITKASILFFISSVPLILFNKKYSTNCLNKQAPPSSSSITTNKEGWEEATMEDIESGVYESI